MKNLLVFMFLLILTGSLVALTGFGDSTVNVLLEETIPDGPLPVELSSFTASITVDQFVELQWVTEAESNLLGYNVYRGEESTLNSSAQVNPHLIPAGNTSVSTAYSFSDESVENEITYYYWLQVNEIDLNSTYHGPVSVTVSEESEDFPVIPEKPVTSLVGAYPNPFNPATTISFSLAEKSDVTISVFNVRGQLMKTLFTGQTFAPGNHRVLWNGRDQTGKSAPSGIYFYRMLTDDGYEETKKMTILK